MPSAKKILLEEHHAFVKSDSMEQTRLRLLQALWREGRDLPIGSQERPDLPAVELGSRVDDDDERRLGHNFLTPGIRDQVITALEDPACGGVDQGGRLIARQRLWSDLLSSQPLAFNLFGELAVDLGLATAVGRALWGDRIEAVTAVCFEWSPGRDDPRYLANRSAFDVFIAYTTPRGGRGFVGIEVKYHENMRARAAKGIGWYDENPRYREVAKVSTAFAQSALTRVADPAQRGSKESLGGTPLQQIWFDHLLALSMLESEDGWEEGRFVFLHAAKNQRTVNAGERYAATLAEDTTFQSVTLEAFLAAAQSVSDAGWLADFHERYLAMEPVETLLPPE
jgi:hypothetical protein